MWKIILIWIIVIVLSIILFSLIPYFIFKPSNPSLVLIKMNKGALTNQNITEGELTNQNITEGELTDSNITGDTLTDQNTTGGTYDPTQVSLYNSANTARKDFWTHWRNIGNSGKTDQEKMENVDQLMDAYSQQKQIKYQQPMYEFSGKQIGTLYIDLNIFDSGTIKCNGKIVFTESTNIKPKQITVILFDQNGQERHREVVDVASNNSILATWKIRGRLARVITDIQTEIISR